LNVPNVGLRGNTGADVGKTAVPMSTPSPVIRLHSYFRSSSAWRVRIALHLKGLAFETIPVQLSGAEQHQAAFAARNPMRQVPVLEMGDGAEPIVLTQSIAILEYLEERFPDPPLLPTDLVERARTRELAELVNSGIQPLQNLDVRKTLEKSGADADSIIRGYIVKGMEALERRAKETAGRFLVRDSVTFADILLVPQLYASNRFGVATAAFPTLERVGRECELIAAFQAAHPNAQPDFDPSV
jgi:maleylpyruvate isomerase